MSIILGLRRPADQIAQRYEILGLASATQRYAPDGTFVLANGRIGMGCQPFHTTERSRLDSNPVADVSGNIIAFDGRLDNLCDLRRALEVDDRNDSDSDSQLVLAAFRRWGRDCFARLIGEWALSLWSRTDEVLYLARDHAGTRTLFFHTVDGVVQWSTHLETFFARGKTQALDAGYVACFLGSQSLNDLTPYKGIFAVPPAHYLEVRENRIARTSHWNWMVDGKVQLASDEEYEQHFLSLFEIAIQRRIVPGAPILAHLSGGMDSTSIVCAADVIRKRQNSSAGLLDTLSFYDDTEPHWDERPYFSAVEKKRGKRGIHVDISTCTPSFEPLSPSDGVYLLPGEDSSSIKREQQLQESLGAPGYRVILSGIGGDEVLGGVPTPFPELAEYLVSGNVVKLVTRARDWCLVNRSPLMHMLFETLAFTLALYGHSKTSGRSMPPWVSSHLCSIQKEFEHHERSQGSRLGKSPTAICNGSAWCSIIETIARHAPAFLMRHEYRYPYLDRDLVDFLFRVPREQIVRPGRRRSLMRHALRDVVPSEVLDRRRKAYVTRSALSALCCARDKVESLFVGSLAAQCGFLDPVKLSSAIDMTTSGRETKWWPALMRTIALELWLRSNAARMNIIDPGTTSQQYLLSPRQPGADKLRAAGIAS